MTITGQHNKSLKEIRKLRQRRRWRERSGRFVAEGEDLLAAADAAGWQPVERYCAAGSGLPGVEVDAELLASASGLGSGTRTLAVYDERWASAPSGPLCVYLHGVHDPGNVGAVLRSAEAFGASSVALGPGSADPFGPKAVRASMGAVFAIPLANAESLAELPGVKVALVPGRGAPLPELWRLTCVYRTSSAKVREEVDITPAEPRAEIPTPAGPGAEIQTPAEPRAEIPTPAGPRAEIQTPAEPRAEIPTPAGPRAAGPPVTLLIGAEREGLPEDLVAEADLTAHIPIENHSLNAAMAATVALYELTRMARS